MVCTELGKFAVDASQSFQCTLCFGFFIVGLFFEKNITLITPSVGGGGMGGIGRCRKRPTEQKSSWTDAGRDPVFHKFLSWRSKSRYFSILHSAKLRYLQACACTSIGTAEALNKSSLLITTLQVVDASSLEVFEVQFGNFNMLVNCKQFKPPSFERSTQYQQSYSCEAMAWLE